MNKSLFSIQSFLVVVLLLSQFLLPIGSMKAAANSTLLPPSNLVYQTVTPDDGKLNWSAVYGATGYNVYEIKEGQITLLAKTTAASYSLNDLAEGSYRYVVSTLSADGESGPSAPIDVNIEYPEMLAPDTLTHTIQKGSDIVLSWTAAQYAEQYKVFELAEDGHAALLTTTSNRTYTIENAPEGKFTYAVKSVNPLYGESYISSPLEVQLVHPIMVNPANLTFTITNGSDINLSWKAADYAASYKVYQVVDGNLELKQTVTGTSAKFSNVPAGDYIYKVYSYNDRFGESAEGSQAELTVSEITMVPPSSVTPKIQNINDLTLSWGTSPYATGYKIYQVINGERVLKNTVTGTSVTFTNLPGGEYTYEVYSYSDRYGESEQGAPVSATIETVTMEAPQNSSYKIQNGNDLVLTWDATTNANNYKVYQIINGEKILKSSPTGTTATFTNLPDGDYSYEIYSYSTRFGESQEGARQAFSLVHPEMQSPENVIQSIKSPTQFAISWDASLYAANYRIYEIIDGQKKLKTTTTGKTVTYSNMLPGVYNYEVYSYSTRFGESKAGSKVQVTLNGQTMEPPANLTLTLANGNDVTLKWNTAEYANSYKIYQVVDGERVLARTLTGTTAVFSNMPEGDHQFLVTSVSNLLGESPEGSEENVNITFPEMLQPAAFTAKVQNYNDVVLNWGSVQYATSYKIYEKIGDKEELIKTLSSLSTSLSNVTEGTHNYVVRSVSSRFGESVEGAEVSVSVVFPELEEPAGLTHTITNGNDLTLKWTAVSYPSGYKIYEIIDGEKILKKTVSGTSTIFSNLPEGDYDFIVHSSSVRYGDSPEGSKISVTIVHPIMEAPENVTVNIYNGNDIALKWNVSTYATAYKVYQIIDGEKVFQRQVTGTGTTFANMPEGDYEYEVHSYSSRFGESPEASKLTHTLVHPIMQAPVNPTNTITNGNDIVLRWSASTYATGYKIYQIIDGEKVFQRQVTSISTAFTNMPEGDYQYEIHSYSTRFGESPESSEATFNLTWPEVVAPVIVGTVFNANNVKLTWKSVPWANEYRVYKVGGDEKTLIYKGTALTYSVYNLTEESHSFEVTAYSTRFGESVVSNRYSETIVYPEMEAPKASLTLLSETSARIMWDFVTYANGYNIYEIIDGEAVLVAEKVNNLSYTFKNLSYANHLYYVTSYSNSFGESDPSETVLAKLIIDEVAPETTSDAPKDWVKESQAVTLKATDDETGVDKTFYSLNGSGFVEGTQVEVKEEGVNKISFYSVDKVGNKEEAKTVEVKIDKTSPETAAELPAAWVSEDVTITLTAADEHSGIAATYYSINGSEFTDGTSFTVTEEGINKVSYYTVDEAGNQEEAKTAEVKIDKTSPKTASNEPAVWVNEDVTITLTATDSHSGITATYYSINGSEFTEGTSFNVTEEGINKVYYYSVDEAGNKEATKMAEVMIDKTAGVISSNAPDVWVNEDVAVTLTAADDHSGIAKTYYSINGSEFAEGSSIVVDQEGVNEISYYSIDHAGNKEETKTDEVKIDKTLPVITTNFNELYELGSTLQLDYKTLDELSGIASETVIFSRPGELLGTEIYKGSNLTLDQPGDYTVIIIAKDHAGNITSVKKQFTVYIPATVEVTPKVVKGNKGVFTVRVEVPENYVGQLNLDAATLNGVKALATNKGYYNQAKLGQFKFERSDFNWAAPEVSVEFRSLVNGYLVIGHTTVIVKK
ncbi:OmpL47-type beta-barrel domain-containing protein [Mesobacillus harenae]|uniref:OmpL47-type beta-barrel domain-containing protein n=1 Tax=Mesobacillus harenae TaxID=2213203 RepID=UPI0015807079|nr:hypothetical protein [Mesobacillus harenae]